MPALLRSRICHEVPTNSRPLKRADYHPASHRSLLACWRDLEPGPATEAIPLAESAIDQLLELSHDPLSEGV